MNLPNKLTIAADLLKRNICERNGVFYFWNGNDQSSTEALSDNDMMMINDKYNESISEYKKFICKEDALNKLKETDWVTFSDVEIKNKQEFLNYRYEIRKLAINPIEEPTWPNKPTVIWSNL